MAKKDDLPYMPFYIGDWRKATDVQALPLEAKAIWFEMLCYMWESTERGYLTVNGRPIPVPALARMLGLPEDLLKQNLKHILDFGVAEIRESDGAIYCRRMVRDQDIREKRQKAGSKGGKQSFASRFAQANIQANAENEIENISLNINQSRQAFGEFGNVRMNQADYDLLVARHGKELADDAIRRYDLWLVDNQEKSGRTHYAAVQQWPLDEARKNSGNPIAKTTYTLAERTQLIAQKKFQASDFVRHEVEGGIVKTFKLKGTL